MRWTCRGGNKAFYVSPEGNFQYCYHVAPLRPFAQVTRKTSAIRATQRLRDAAAWIA